MRQELPAPLDGLYRWFRRPSTTVSIILILGVLYLLGLFIPQKRFFDSGEHYQTWLDSSAVVNPLIDWLGFTDIYLSPVTLFFLGVFFLNLLVVVIGRIPMVLRQAYIRDTGDRLSFDGPGLRKSAGHRSIPVPERESIKGLTATVERFFRGRGWFTVCSPAGERLVAVKNRLSAFGFLAFHLSFLFCLGGGAAIYYSRFSGDLIATEGQTVGTDRGSFARINREPKLMGGIPQVHLTVDRVTMRYEGGQGSELTADVAIAGPDGEIVRETIGVNRPVRYETLAILVKDAGVSPLFKLRDSDDGKELDGAWFSLNVVGGVEDSFQFVPGGDILYRARFYADHFVDEDGMDRSRSMEIRNPAFHVAVERDGETIAAGTLRGGEALLYGPLMIEFTELRHWVEIQIVREFGTVPLVVGFVFGLLGLVMRLIFYRKEIRVAVEPDGITLTGNSQFYPESFADEMDGMIERLRNETGAEG